MTEKQLPSWVLWLDPGLTTGWACLVEGVTFSSGQVRGRVEWGDFLQRLLSSVDAEDAAIGWEAYLVGQGGRLTGDPVPALEVIGVTRWLCHHHAVETLPSVPAASRVIGTLAALKALGWEWRGNHALAASQHLLAWLVREKLMDERLQEVYGDTLKRYNRNQEAIGLEE